MDEAVINANTSTLIHSVSRSVDAHCYKDHKNEQRQEMIAEEVPIALVYNNLSFAVMLATPADLEDFAVGFSITEGIVTKASGLNDIAVEHMDEGIKVYIGLSDGRFDLLRQRRRNLMGASSCGMCGTESFVEALRPIDPVQSKASFTPAAIYRAMAELPALQTLNRQLGAVHGAAFADADGHLLAAREDVGRHNALDKLIGHLARSRIDASKGFVAVSSRCSYEMVRKAAAAGIPLIATISAPTALAVHFSDVTGVCMAAFARDNRFTVYANPQRVRDEA